MSIKNPVFIVGTGRCGSTLFHDVLTEHQRIGWLSSMIDKNPYRPERNRLVNKFASIPAIGPYIRRKYHPSEPYRFWESYCHGFATPYRDLKKEDVLPPVIPKIKSALKRAIPEDRRLVAKITGWPRIGYLKQIFPGAKFIHIVRDGRAVVNSVLAAPYFEGWSGPHNWTRGTMNERQEAIWRESGESFVVLAAIGYENRMRAFSEAKQLLNESDYLEIPYETLCENPVDAYKKTFHFIGEDIDNSDPFFYNVGKKPIRSKNTKWKTDLTDEQRHYLEKLLENINLEYGY